MLKLLKWMALGFAVVLTILIAVLDAVLGMRDRELALRKPATLSDLNALGVRLALAAKNEALPQSLAEVTSDPDAAQLEAMTAPSQPTRLARSLSAQQREQRKVTQPKQRLMLWAGASILRIGDGISHVVYMRSLNGPHPPMGIGLRMMELGKWESARHYLWAVVDEYETSAPTQVKIALGQLAWLEDDPEKASPSCSCLHKANFQHPIKTASGRTARVLPLARYGMPMPSLWKQKVRRLQRTT